MASVINQIKLGDVEYAIAASAYAECCTSSDEKEKVATICTDSDTANTTFTLIKGVSVQVKFTDTNAVGSPTLNVNNTGAKPIYYKGNTLSAIDNYLKPNGIYTFVYDSDSWNLVGDNVNMDINNFPSGKVLITSTNGGITSSDITTTNLNCLSGAVTNIQSQLDGKAPTSHASTGTSYGVGTTDNYGHVKTQTGDMNGTSSTSGVAAGLGHTHSQYAYESALHESLIPDEGATYTLGTSDARYLAVHTAEVSGNSGYISFGDSGSGGCIIASDDSIGISAPDSMSIESDVISMSGSDYTISTSGSFNVSSNDEISFISGQAGSAEDNEGTGTIEIGSRGKINIWQAGGEFSYSVLQTRAHHVNGDLDACQGVEVYLDGTIILSNTTYIAKTNAATGTLPAYNNTTDNFYAVPCGTRVINLSASSTGLYCNLSIQESLSGSIGSYSMLYSWLKNNGFTDASGRPAYPCSGAYQQSGTLGTVIGIRASSDTSNKFILDYLTASSKSTFSILGSSLSFTSTFANTPGSVTGVVNL